MPAALRVDPKDYFTPEEWAPLTARSSWKGIALVVHCWALILAAAAVGTLFPITIPLAVMIIGARQLGLAILMHDAAHGALHTDPKLNDALGHWLCAIPIGADLPAYRAYHLQHHRFTQQAEDPDLGLSAPFPVTRASLRRKMIRDLTGQTFFKQRVRPLFTGRPGDDREGASFSPPSGAPFVLVNLAALAVLSALGLWWTWFVFWLLPMATWFPLVTRLRNIAEHAMVPDNDDPLRYARTTHAGFLERLLIAPYWVNFHGEHHMFMYLPCWSLPAAHRALTAKGVTERMAVEDGYWTVLTKASGKPVSQ
jgi:fatty acid desaturase